MLKVIGVEPCIQHVMAVGADANVENLVTAGCKAGNGGGIENALLTFDRLFDRRKEPFAVDIQKSKELLPLGDGLVVLASPTRLQLILNGPNGTASRLRGELMLAMVFHVILCIVVSDAEKETRTQPVDDA